MNGDKQDFSPLSGSRYAPRTAMDLDPLVGELDQGTLERFTVWCEENRSGFRILGAMREQEVDWGRRMIRPPNEQTLKLWKLWTWLREE